MVQTSHMKKDLVILIVYLLLVATLTSLDIFIDVRSGASYQHIWLEVSLVAGLSLGIIFSIKKLVRGFNNKINRSAVDLAHWQKEAQEWRNQASDALCGLAQQIDRQFQKWHFSSSEKQVAFFLLKGLSLKEISQLRGVQEKTVRQQASCLYQKAGLKGRAELSAFFLEDLMSTPISERRV